MHFCFLYDAILVLLSNHLLWLSSPAPLQCLPYIQEGSIDKIIDPRMPLPELIDNVHSFARIAAACVAPSRRDRPDMARVALLLAELKQPAEVRSPVFQEFQTSGRVVSP